MKPMANSIIIPANSAVSWTMKLSTYRQEVYRILRNTSASLPWDVKAGHLTRLCWRTKESWYDRSFRRKVIQEGLRCFENAVHEARMKKDQDS